MDKRYKARKYVSYAKGRQKVTQLAKYNKLRNLVTSQIRKENVAFNNDIIQAAKDDNEIWKVVKEVTNPKQANMWSKKIDGTRCSDTFNKNTLLTKSKR